MRYIVGFALSFLTYIIVTCLAFGVAFMAHKGWDSGANPNRQEINHNNYAENK